MRTAHHHSRDLLLAPFVAAALLAGWPRLLRGDGAGGPDTRRPACPDQAAALLSRVESLVSRFKEEVRAAEQTPRPSLPSGLWRLREIRRETLELPEWPENTCEVRLRETLEAAQSFDIRKLEAFMGGARPSGHREAKQRWADADRHLKALRELVEATR